MKVLVLANQQEKHVIRGSRVSYDRELVMQSISETVTYRKNRKNIAAFPVNVRGSIATVTAATQTLVDVTNSGKLFCVSVPNLSGLADGCLLRVTLDGVVTDISLDYTNTPIVGFNYGLGGGEYPLHIMATQLWSGSGWKYEFTLKVELVLTGAPTVTTNAENQAFVQYLNEGQTTATLHVDKV